MSLPTASDLNTLAYASAGQPFTAYQPSTADTTTLAFASAGQSFYAQGGAAAAAALAAAVAAQSTVTGALSTGIPLAGALVDAVTSSGDISTGIALAGVATDVVTTTGDLTTAINLAGVLAAEATATAALHTVSYIFHGNIAASVTMVGDLAIAARLASAAVASASLTGALSTSIPLAGDLGTQATFLGDLQQMTGLIAVVSVAIGSLSTGIQMSASAVADSEMSGTLPFINRVYFEGHIAAASFAVANLTADTSLAGTYRLHPVWMFPPNWDHGVLERLEWKTDVLSSEVGAEQRVSRRLTPRRSFEATFLIPRTSRQYFQNQVGKFGSSVWVLPVWHQVTRLTATAVSGSDTLYLDTRWREYVVGGLVVLRSSDPQIFEVGNIINVQTYYLQLSANLTKTWSPATSYIYPGVLARLTDNAVGTKLTDQLFEARARFQTATANPYSSDWIARKPVRVYSTRLVVGDYTGPCMKVRRSSDDAVRDIPFAGRKLDVFALLDFVGGGDGHVARWYDQSANGVDAIQASNSGQPLVVIAGAVVRVKGHVAIYFNNNNLVFSNVNAIVEDYTLISVFSTTQHSDYSDGGQGYGMCGFIYSDIGGNATDYGFGDLGGKLTLWGGGVGGERSVIGTSHIEDGHIHVGAATRVSSTGGCSIYVDGNLEMSDSGNPGTRTPTIGSIGSGGYGNNGSPQPAVFYTTENIIYNEALGYSDLNYALADIQSTYLHWSPATVEVRDEVSYLEGVPVITIAPDDSQDLSFEYRRLVSTLDNNLGIPDVFDVAERPFRSMQYRWSYAGRANNDGIRRMFYWLRGRARKVWVPTFMSDFTLAANVTAGDAVLTVKNTGYARNSMIDIGSDLSPSLWSRIRIELWGGNVIYRTILGAAEVDAGTEALTLDAQFDVGFTPDSVKYISYMINARLDQDSVEINHVVDADGLTQIVSTWVEAEDASLNTVFPPYCMYIGVEGNTYHSAGDPLVVTKIRTSTRAVVGTGDTSYGGAVGKLGLISQDGSILYISETNGVGSGTATMAPTAPFNLSGGETATNWLFNAVYNPNSAVRVYTGYGPFIDLRGAVTMSVDTSAYIQDTGAVAANLSSSRIAVQTGTEFVFVMNAGSRGLIKVSTLTGAVQIVLPVDGVYTQEMYYSPDTHRLYVENNATPIDTPTVTAIDGNTFTSLGVFPGAAVTPIYNRGNAIYQGNETFILGEATSAPSGSLWKVALHGSGTATLFGSGGYIEQDPATGYIWTPWRTDGGHTTPRGGAGTYDGAYVLIYDPKLMQLVDKIRLGNTGTDSMFIMGRAES